jgi:hypothetical protein
MGCLSGPPGFSTAITSGSGSRLTDRVRWIPVGLSQAADRWKQIEQGDGWGRKNRHDGAEHAARWERTFRPRRDWFGLSRGRGIPVRRCAPTSVTKTISGRSCGDGAVRMALGGSRSRHGRRQFVFLWETLSKAAAQGKRIQPQITRITRMIPADEWGTGAIIGRSYWGMIIEIRFGLSELNDTYLRAYIGGPTGCSSRAAAELSHLCGSAAHVVQRPVGTWP